MGRAMDLRPVCLVVSAVLGLGGCATLDHGTTDDVPVVSDPPGASISSSTGTICTSPCIVSGPRRESFVITVAKPGYVTQAVVAAAKPNEGAVAAASSTDLTPDILGRIVDVQDGTYYTHVPAAIVVKLVPTK